MDLRPELIASGVSSILSIGIAWGVSKAHGERMWGELREMKQWQDEHRKDSFQCRYNFSQDISGVRTDIKVRDEQYQEILRRLDSIETKIERRLDKDI